MTYGGAAQQQQVVHLLSEDHLQEHEERQQGLIRKYSHIAAADPHRKASGGDDHAFAYLIPQGEGGDDDDADSDVTAVTFFVPEWGDGLRNWVRARLLYNPWFERFWLTVILANCVTLAMEDPTDKHCVTKRCGFTHKADYIFTNLFVVEMLLKLVGLGLYSRHDAYIRDSWNLMDGIIVISGMIAFLMDVVLNLRGPALTGLRAFRLLRPLKAVQAFPAVRILIQSILVSLPALGDVFILYFFFLLVMGIVAVQQWKGSLRYHCVTEASVATRNTSLYVIDSSGRSCTLSSNIHVGGHHCEWGSTCVEFGGNPEGGLLSFDNIGVSSLTLFVALTLEGWTDSMYYTMDATTYFAAFFWVILVIVGSFFILNLTIVIITEAFEMKQYEQKTSAFRAIDKDGGGELDRDEVRKLLTKCNGGQPVSEAELDKVFSEMDIDGGGTVSLEEFLIYADTHQGAVGVALSKGGKRGLAKEVKLLLGRLTCVANLAKHIEEAAESPAARGPFRDWLYQLCEPTGRDTRMPRANSLFHTSIMAAIMLNTIALAIEHHGQPQVMSDVLHTLNFVFTVFFAAEAVVKIVALGAVGYFSESFNCFDFLVSVLSLVGLFGLGGNVSVFRTFRALRVLRLAKQVPLLQRWIGILLASMKGAAVLTCLLALLVFIVALLGMQLFGGNFCHLEEGFDPTAASLTAAERGKERGCGGVPRSHYDDLGTALMTTFQILTGEDWNKIMYNGMRASGNWVSVYFVLYYMLGNYMMLNLFIAVLLNSRDPDAGVAESNASEEGSSTGHAEAQAALETGKEPLLVEMRATDESPASPGYNYVDWGDITSPAPGGSVVLKRGFPEEVEKAAEEANTTWIDRFAAKLPPPLQARFYSETALFVLSPYNPIRSFMMRVCTSNAFEVVVMLCIGVSTVTLALESPIRPPDHPTERTLAQINFVMVWVFLLELLTKVFAMGFIMHPTSYLRKEVWNILDFVIVLVSLLSLIVPGGGNIEFIKIMRTLRPLRFINKSEGMKVVVQALIRSFKPLSNVLLISLLVWLIFGIMGVQIFSGKFYRCSLAEYGDMEDSLGIRLRTDCLNYTLCKDATTGEACRWQNYDSHFDHLPAAFLNLFEMASLEGWVDVMNLGIDSISHDEAPVRNNSPWMALYFLIFIVFGAFFIINMFIGVLIDTYYQEKEKACNSGGIFLNSKQKLWVDHHTKMLNVMQSARKSQEELLKSKSWLHTAMTSRFCDVFITSCIVLNVLMMAMEHYPESSTTHGILSTANFVFFGVFAAEATLKLLGFGVQAFFADPWNRFDFTVVMLSTFGVVMEVFLGGGAAVSVFRILRLARLLRMVKKAKGIKRILRTLLLSLPSMMNVAGILFLMFFIYAVLGVKLFARLQRGGPDNAMGPYANFENFAFSLLLLLRMTTGEAWQSVLQEARVNDAHHCDKQLGNCGNPWVATIYFCSFTLSGMYVLLNLFIAVILDAFSQSNDDGVCTDDYMEDVMTTWRRYEVRDVPVGDETGIEADKLYEFLKDIGEPLGVPRDCSRMAALSALRELEIQVVPAGHKLLITHTELIPKLFAHRYGQNLPPDMQEKLMQDEQKCEALTSTRPRSASMAALNQQSEAVCETLQDYVLIMKMQAQIRGWLVRVRARRAAEAAAAAADGDGFQPAQVHRHPLVPGAGAAASSVGDETATSVCCESPREQSLLSSLAYARPVPRPLARPAPLAPPGASSGSSSVGPTPSSTNAEAITPFHVTVMPYDPYASLPPLRSSEATAPPRASANSPATRTLDAFRKRTELFTL